MKIIRLNLGPDWYYFTAQRFRPVGKKRNFVAGDLLYRDSEFYLVVPRKKLKKISWNHAGKRIYGELSAIHDRNNFRISKKKILFAFEINPEEEVQTCLKDGTLSFQPTNYELAGTNTAQHKMPEFAEKRAKAIFCQMVRAHSRLKVRNNSLYVRSRNHRTYRISLKSGVVYDLYDKSICVYSPSSTLPFYDILLGKALTIAYAPERIYTL